MLPKYNGPKLAVGGRIIDIGEKNICYSGVFKWNPGT